MNYKYILTAILVMAVFSGTASAWLDGYNYRQPITLTGGASGPQTDYQVLLNVTYTTHMQADFDDLRFTQADGSTPIDAWLESNTTDYALTWVDFPTTPSDGATQTYYIYYGNAGAASDWNGSATFPLFDDFNDVTINTDIWTTNVSDGSPTFTEENGYLRILAAASTDNGHVYSNNNFSDVSFRWRYRAVDDSNTQVHASDVSGDVSQNGERLVWAAMSSVWKFDKCVDGSYSDIGSTSHDTTSWWIGELSRNSTLARVFLNNVQVGADQTVNAGAKYLVFSVLQESELRVDWALGRKYATNPPTYAFSSEEDSGNAPPSWGNQSKNVPSIQQGGTIYLSANGYDATGLNYAWLSTNESGSWQNFTDVDQNADNYQILTQSYLNDEDCCGTYRVTAYSEITGDYTKFLFYHTPYGTPGQVAAFRWYYPANNTWSADHVAFDDYETDASTLTIINATRWMYTIRKISDNSLYDIWTSDAGATWSSPVASPFNGTTTWVKYAPIDNDTSKVFVYWRPTADSGNLHQKFFYLENESYSADTVAWAISGNDDEITGKIVLVDGTYYAYMCADTGYAQYRTSTDLKTWSGSISSGVPRANGWGYSVDCDDNCCYMTQVHTDRENYFYSINKSLLNTTGWTYRLNLNVSNLGLPTLKVINNTHVITTAQDNVNQKQYARLVNTHTITDSNYGSPLSFSGSTDWNWANFTWSNPSYSDTTIGWKIYFNDTSGLTNCTDVMSFDISGTSSGCGAYNITLPSGWSIIGWTNPTASTAHAMGGLIGGNCQYVVERNRTTGAMVYHNMGVESINNFAIERGWGYYVSTTAETLWERDS